MAYTNLFDGWLEQGNIGIDTSTPPGQNIDSSVRIRSRNYIKVSASTSYSMYRKYANGGFGVRYYDSSKTFLSNASPFASTTKGGLFVTPANCAYIRFIDETNRLDNRYWMAKSTVLLDDSKFAQVIAIGQCTLYDVTDVYTSATEPPMAERYDGFLWLDTATDTIKKWDAASKQWVILNDFTDAIQDAVDNLKVSSVNRALKTATPYVRENWTRVSSGNTVHENVVSDMYFVASDIDGQKTVLSFDITFDGIVLSDNASTTNVPSVSVQLASPDPDASISQYPFACRVTDLSDGTAHYVLKNSAFSWKKPSGIKLRLRSDYIKQGTATISNLRLVTGDKEADWSPAPEDVQEQLNDIVSDSVLTPSEKLILANEMERIKQETGNLIASAEDLSMSYADLKSAYDALYKYINPFITEAMMQVNSNIDAEKYKTLFKNYYTAKEALEQAIKSELNVEIGGTQLLQHSHFPVGTKKWNLCGGKASVSTSVKFRGRNSVKIVGAGTAIAERLNPLEAYYAPYTAGEMLTLRFWIMCPDVSKVTSDVQAFIAYRKDGYAANGANSKLITKDNFVNAGNSTWLPVTITGKSDVIENIWCTALIQFNNTAATFYVSSPKLEYGTRPTDYCQSEEDAQEEVDALKRYTRNILLTSGNYYPDKRIKWQGDSKEQWSFELYDGYIRLIKDGTGAQSWACLPLSQSIVVGETYTLMFKFRRSLAQNFNLYLINYAGRSSYTIDYVVETIAANEWQTHTVTFTATSSMSNADYLMLTSTDFTVDKETIDFEWLILSKGDRIDEWSPAYEDVDDVYDTLNDEVSYAKSTLGEVEDKVEAIKSSYATLTETVGNIQKTVGSMFTQSPDDISMTFMEKFKSGIDTDISNAAGAVSDALEQYEKTVETYIRFSTAGIELGENESPFKAKLNNVKLAFLQDDMEVAYISNNKLYITESETAHRQTLGNAEKGYFDWIVEDNGSLSLARRNV